MITESQMYWLTRLDNLHEAAAIIGVIASIIFGIAIIMAIIYWSEENDYKPFLIILPCFLLSMVIAVSSCFIPTTKEMCAIKAIPLIVNDEQVQEIPTKIVDLANEWLEELKPNKNKETKDD